jgi:hypothetical protein
MGLNFGTLVYLPNFTMFARVVTFLPAGGAAYSGRGIYDSDNVNVPLDDGSFLSDQQTILDIMDADFLGGVLPQQGDHVFIGTDFLVPAEGEFEIINTSNNGGGETTLQLRRWLGAPTPFPGNLPR